MKRLLVSAGLVLALLCGGLWWALRREPSAAPLDAPESVFTVRASGPGRLITFQDALVPLRAFRWLAPLPGMVAAQVLSQNDRQRVALFREGQPQETLLVLKPLGVSDGFWRFAELRQAVMAPGGILLLLYQPGEPGSAEASLALALDVASQQVRWFFRGAFSRMAATPGSEAVYCFGGKGPILRLALDQPAMHPTPASIETPPEIEEVEDLLPTGVTGFLVSHRKGLSCYRENAWTTFPGPGDRGVACQDFHSSLARARTTLWWQAVPGRLVQVRTDGTPVMPWEGELPPEDPFARDARLLRMLGADPAGSIWFALAHPAPLAPPAAPPAPAAQNPAAPGTAPAPAPEDWGAYAAAGLNRLYRWDPARKSLARIALPDIWPTLQPPPTVRPPAFGQGLVPAAGALLAEGVRCAWWLPLEALQTPAQAM